MRWELVTSNFESRDELWLHLPPYGMRYGLRARRLGLQADTKRGKLRLDLGYGTLCGT